jgi:hypothetical protein
VSAKARVVLTVALGALMGLLTWLASEGLSPSPGVEEVFNSTPIEVASLTILALVPLVVGRWWVLAALAGPVAALVTLQLTGHKIHELDGWAPPLNPVTIFGLLFLALVMLILVGIRRTFDFWRGRRATAGP